MEDTPGKNQEEVPSKRLAHVSQFWCGVQKPVSKPGNSGPKHIIMTGEIPEFPEYPDQELQNSFMAGYYAKKNGIGIQNSHSSFFASPECEAAWRKGYNFRRG